MFNSLLLVFLMSSFDVLAYINWFFAVLNC